MELKRSADVQAPAPEDSPAPDEAGDAPVPTTRGAQPAAGPKPVELPLDEDDDVFNGPPDLPPAYASSAAPTPTSTPTPAPQASVPTPPPSSGNMPVQSSSSSGGGAAGALSTLEAEGFQGLELGFGAFPMITLPGEGIFQHADIGDMGTEFEVVIYSTRAKWIFKTLEKQGAEFVYTYDGTRTLKGTLVENQIKAWEAAGRQWEQKKYLDAMATIVGGDLDGEYVLLSIPPASITRLSGFLAIQQQIGLKPSQFVTRVSRGPKIKAGGAVFYPWAFSRSKTPVPAQ